MPQEEELADAKRPDIRVHCVGFDGPVPIELKIADKWNGTQLVERLRNQLCGQYLRDPRSNCGIYLLTYCGRKIKWICPKTRKNLDFKALIQQLEYEAKEIVGNDSKLETIEIIGIDLTKRNALST